MPILTVSASSPELDAGISLQLQRGCAALDIAVSGDQQAQLVEYLALLDKWNKTYNLTAVRDASQMVSRHLLDSLAIAPYVHGQRCLDVGSGAGLPGVPLAIVFPRREFELLDSNGKKTRFLFQVKTALCLDNMEVHQARAESFRGASSGAELFDAVFSRAFASLSNMLQACRHLLASDGRFLAMKGAYPEDELEAVKNECDTINVYPIVVPGLGEKRHLVEMILPPATNQ